MTAEKAQFEDDDKTYVDLGYAESEDFDDDATIIRPLDAEMMWVLVTEKENIIKLPLSEGVPVCIGREKGQDAVLVSQIVSRQHLILTRHGDMIDAEIIGANGVQFDGVALKKETRKLIPPARIDIGSDIKLEISKDDPSVSPVASSPPSPPAASASSSVPTPVETPASSTPPSPKSAQTIVPPVSLAGSPPPLHDLGQKKNILAGLDQKKIMIGGGMLAVLIIVGLILVLSGGGDSDEKSTADAITLTPKEVPRFKTDQIPEVAEKKVLKSQGSNLHSLYLTEARKLYEKGQMAEALEYLQDIPPTSPFYEDAVALTRKINGK